MFSQAIPKPYNNVHDDEQLALGHKGIWVITQNALHALFSTAPPPLPAFPPNCPSGRKAAPMHELLYCMISGTVSS